jgi:hypothetical protein
MRTIVLVALVAAGLAACAQGAGAGREDSGQDDGMGGTSNPASAPQDRAPGGTGTPAPGSGSGEGGAVGRVGCGRPFPGPAASAQAVDLRVSGRFPRAAPAGQGSVAGAVEVTASRAVTGVGAAAADAFLVRQGRVVATPAPQDLVGVRWELGPDTPHRLVAQARLASCVPPAAALPPGDYEVYVRVAFTPDSGPGGGTVVEGYGGPWPLQVG